MSRPTKTLGEVLQRLYDMGYDIGAPPQVRRFGLTTPVRIIIDGVAHPVIDVWFEPQQDGVPTICIGEDPR